ncbi:MAG: hypothetical protein WB805_08325 [Candidatus Dormiibacterota bacterium]
MSPGSGSASLHRRDARVNRSTWMLPWLLPVGLLGVVALISLANVLGYLLVMLWGWLVFPFVALYIRSRAQARRGVRIRDAFRDDADTDYWRTRSR